MSQCGKCKNFNKSMNLCAVRGTFHKPTDVGLEACVSHFVEGEPFEEETPMYILEDAVEFISDRCGHSEGTIRAILMLEEEYMRSIGLMEEI